MVYNDLAKPTQPGTHVKSKILKRKFFDRETEQVARDLLGKKLIRVIGANRICGIITETEAYIGESDLGCHAKAGRTKRTQVMYGPAGHAYVYFTYGVHWMLNAVTERINFPAAVLIRSIFVIEGMKNLQAFRPSGDTNGPAKITQAMAVDGSQNGTDLTKQEMGLWIEEGISVIPNQITSGARVGLNSVPEPWKSIPWNFHITILQDGTLRE
jgi:DNA-3-methyladenine glycosylase